ncbi:hypothetical protein FHS34_001903 [Streptomyces echinatus]|uniref:Uncharacterized protein n=1 Tax=Streptomyces echinatus TaxID=67293 RepID=A0A7W9UPL3_9ACTN|nr:hypothetical protein [Streptomyces echinatus]
MSTAARIGSALSAAAAWTIAMISGGLSEWTTATFAVGALLLVAVVLFSPSETPARRLSQLIQAWRAPVEAAGHNPAQPPASEPPSPGNDRWG